MNIAGVKIAGLNFHTYVLLEQGADFHLINQQIASLTRNDVFPVLSKQLGLSHSWKQFNEVGNSVSFSLFPVADIHLHSNRVGEIGENGSGQTFSILVALTFFVLLMACVNYVNLSTTQWMSRAREVGLRKVLGGSWRSLTFQLLSESLIIVFSSAVISVFLSFLGLPFFNEILKSTIEQKDILTWSSITFLAVVSASVGLLSAAYPAFNISNFMGLATGGHSLSDSKNGATLRKALVVFQLSVSAILIICTVVVYSQIDFIRNTDIGYSKNHVLVIDNIQSLGSNVKAFKQQLYNSPAYVPPLFQV